MHTLKASEMYIIESLYIFKIETCDMHMVAFIGICGSCSMNIGGGNTLACIRSVIVCCGNPVWDDVCMCVYSHQVI